MTIKFTKLQSAGNDFVLVETDGDSHEWSRLARDICRRNYGVGADGLLLLLPSRVADLGMRVINADGSESEACGNGLRCLVKYAIDNGLTDAGADEVSIETIAGIRKARLIVERGKVNKIQVAMGKPEFEADKIPVLVEPGKGRLVDIKLITGYSLDIDGKELMLSFVSMGNPHAIYFWEGPVSEFPLSQIGQAVEKHRLFPRRVNFEVASIINRRRIDVRVWERGVGETLACGSGACAVAVAAQILGYVDNPVDIILPGGTLEVAWDREGEVVLSGMAQTVFTGELPE
ncbi:MAG: diaminopimelate epimerase [Dehalococcoidales bacterium]|nr:diaminopimelate epimerase [Dehalococcoidales bacterium]